MTVSHEPAGPRYVQVMTHSTKLTQVKPSPTAVIAIDDAVGSGDGAAVIAMDDAVGAGGSGEGARQGAIEAAHGYQLYMIQSEKYNIAARAGDSL